MPFQSAIITEWKYIDKSIKYTCLFFLYSLWSVKIHAVIQTSKEIDRVCIIRFRFLHTKQRIYKCNEPGTTSKTNGTAKHKKQSKQLLREYRKANTWYSWFLWLWQSSSRWENNSRPEKTSPVKPCRCQDKCWMSELERERGYELQNGYFSRHQFLCLALNSYIHVEHGGSDNIDQWEV